MVRLSEARTQQLKDFGNVSARNAVSTGERFRFLESDRGQTYGKRSSKNYQARNRKQYSGITVSTSAKRKANEGSDGRVDC